MGWLWSSGSQESKPSEVSQAPPSSSTPSDSPPKDGVAPLPPHAAKPTPTPKPKAKAKAKAREEDADAELQKLIEEINHAPSDYAPSSKKPPVSTGQKATKTRTSLPTPSDSPIDPVALLPTTMSCRSCFDLAFYCQSPGGQLANVYRYGTLRNCKGLWSEFWFCMRTNRGYMPPEERARRIQEHYWRREEKYRNGPSSDDVWKTRKDMEPEAFQGDWADLESILKGQQQQQQQQQAGKDGPS